MEDLIQKIMLRAYQITKKGKYQIFIHYSGHINSLTVFYYNDGLWNDTAYYSSNKRHKIIEVYLDGEYAEKGMIKALEKLDEMYEEE